jgi:hypothetical protein
MAAPAIYAAHEPIITFKLENSKPVDLIDLTSALAAFEECYHTYVTQEGYDVDPGNVRLFVREFGTGHIVADLASKAERDSLGLSQLETAAGFISHFDKILGYFQLSPPLCAEVPTAREADQIISIMEPVAKDRAAYLHLFANGESDGRSPYDSKRAQTIQRMARRFLGANGPSNEVPPEELLALFQTVDEAPVKAGERKLFLVDAELKAEIGNVRLYRVLKVKDFFGCG